MLPPDSAPVTTFRIGEPLLIRYLAVAPELARRLRDVGVREGGSVSVLANGDKCVLGVGESRIALTLEVAMGLFATAATNGTAR